MEASARQRGTCGKYLVLVRDLKRVAEKTGPHRAACFPASLAQPPSGISRAEYPCLFDKR